MKKTILLSGGGTSGSVTPLLAFYEDIEMLMPDKYRYFWVGTKTGPEKEMIKGLNIKFKAIDSGKFRRYFSWKNFLDIFWIFSGFLGSLNIIRHYRPSLVMSAGSFVSVPLAWAAWLYKVPVLIHQQDIRPGLANKLMAPFAKTVTVTFKKSLRDYGKKAKWLGNPVRREFRERGMSRRFAREKLGLRSKKPVLLVLGGGTGAAAINDIIKASISELNKFCQIIHIAGKDKARDFYKISARNPDYKCFEFLNSEGMLKIFTVADIAVSRAGMGALTEICYFKIPAMIIPMPDTHQEENAAVFKESRAALVMDQGKTDKEAFVKELRKLNASAEAKETYKKNLAQVIKICDKKELGLILEDI